MKLTHPASSARKVMALAAVMVGSCLATGPANAGEAAFYARKQVRKSPDHLLVETKETTGRIVVKFVDELDVRVNADGTVSATGLDFEQVQDLFEQYDLRARSFYKGDPSVLAALEARARDKSGRQQPRLSNMLHVYAPQGMAGSVAQAFNRLDSFEWVNLEKKRYTNDGGSSTDSAKGFKSVTYDENGTAIEIRQEEDGGPIPTGADGACCLLGNCDDGPFTPTECAAVGGVFLGDVACVAADDCAVGICCDGTDCNGAITNRSICEGGGGVFVPDGECSDEGDNPCDQTDACGEALTGDCFVVDGNGSAYCTDLGCCNTVCNVDPFCCDLDNGAWDNICAAQANLLCPVPAGADRCLNPTAGPCYDRHNTGGCGDNTCCTEVCGFDGECCGGSWDDACVAAAIALCGTPGDAPGPSPALGTRQGYTTIAGWNDPAPANMDIPTAGGDIWPGFTGEGHELRTPGEPFTDLNGNAWWDVGEPFVDDGEDGQPGTGDTGEGDGIWTKPGGIWGFAEELLRVDGVNGARGNATTGRGTKVAVLDFGIYPDHEDLGNVDLEAGQTLFLDPSVDDPDHGTAVTSIIAATRNGIGINGMLPQARTTFYPLTSVNDGPRELTAWVNALSDLEAGDIICAAYGLENNTLNTQQETWTLLRIATDLGICVCISAGNDCFNLDDAEDFGDSGAFVCSGGSPGTPWYRIVSSNYCFEPDVLRGNIIHLTGWGSKVVAAGYGDFFAPDSGDGTGPDKNRAYTAAFGGSSAAVPQLASVIGALQGLARQFYGIPVTPEQVREALDLFNDDIEPARGSLNVGFGQNNCTLDINPEADESFSGKFPDLVGTFISAAPRILNSSVLGLDESQFIEDIVVVRGDLFSGNFYSIKGDDNNYLQIVPERTNRNDSPGQGVGLGTPVSPGGFNVPEADKVTYLADGDIADVIAVGFAQTDEIDNFTPRVIIADPGVYAFVFVEAYDWRSESWDTLGLGFNIPGTAPETEYPTIPLFVPAPQRYLREGDERFLLRAYMVGMPGFGITGPDDFRMKIDLMAVDLTEPAGEG